MLHTWLRPGNMGVGRYVVEFLKEALKLLPVGMRIRCVRVDSGFIDQKILGFLEGVVAGLHCCGALGGSAQWDAFGHPEMERDGGLL
jgi:hypothetical protein